MKRARKQIEKTLDLKPKTLPKEFMVDELVDQVGEMSLDDLTECAKQWRRVLLKKVSLAEIRAMHRQEVRGLDPGEDDDGDVDYGY